MGEEKNAYRVLAGRFEWQRPLGKLRHRWEENTAIVLKGT
jgi:hypothetical protein